MASRQHRERERMVVPAGASKRYVWLGLRCIRAVVSSTDR